MDQFRFFRGKSGRYFLEDTRTHKQTSLRTQDHEEAKRLLAAHWYTLVEDFSTSTKSNSESTSPPLRGRMAAIEAQANKIKEDAGQQREWAMPNEEALKAFADEAATTLTDLSFSQKRGIVVSAIDKVVATQEKLKIYGYIPLNHVALRSEHRHGRDTNQKINFQTHIAFCSEHRHGQDAIEHLRDGIAIGRIPFYFDISMPPPPKTGLDYGFKRAIKL